MRAKICWPLAIGLCLLAGYAAWADEPAGKRYALLVGIADYEHPRLRAEKLRYTLNDAQEMADTLGKLGYIVVLLTDDTGKQDADRTPTKAHIDGQLHDLLRKAGARDTVLIGLAGHGLQFAGQKDAYFCPIDARPFANEIDTMVSISHVYDELDKSFASVKVLLVDACRDDPSPDRGSRGLDADNSPPPPKGVGALFSCSAGQRAYEHAQLKHGVFFYYVLEGFKGKAAHDGDVTFDNLALYVRRNVPRKVKELIPEDKPDQFPNLKADLSGEPALLARVEIAPLAPRGPAGPSPPVNPPDREQSQNANPNSDMLRAPFDADAAKAAQQRWAQKLGRQALETNSLGMKLALIPPGEFMMGSPESEIGTWNGKHPEDEKQHRVRITKPFYMAAYDVTLGNFLTFYHDSGYKTEAETDGKGGWGFDSDGHFGMKPEYTFWNWGKKQTNDHPVVNVSWNDAQEFCKWLSKKEGKTYRLPSEAEWEYACRSGTTTHYNCGDSLTKSDANIAKDGNFLQSLKDGNTTPVGSFKPNAFGLYDMHGNVLQWCQDRYDKDYYNNSPSGDPQGPDAGSPRVFRGGGWHSSAVVCRSAFRGYVEPPYRSFNVGFRVVCER